MDSYQASKSGAAPHYSDLSNPQIMETLQKQNYGQSQVEEGAGDVQSQDQAQEGKTM